MASHRAYIGLGANLDNPKQQLTTALSEIDALPCCSIENVSAYYRTKPIGGIEQNDFVNAAALISTTLSPLALLNQLHQIEADHQRTRDQRWGPRTLDLDILIYDQQRWCSEKLWLPHPRMLERAFVLKPLSDISPDMVLNNRSLSGWLDDCAAQQIALIREPD